VFFKDSARASNPMEREKEGHTWDVWASLRARVSCLVAVLAAAALACEPGG